MAHQLLHHAVALSASHRNFRKRTGRRIAPVTPDKRVELHYRYELQQLVNKVKDAGMELARALQPGWNPPRQTSDGIKARDSEPPDLDRSLSREVDRFGNIGARADEMAAAMASRSLKAVDQRLTKSIMNSVGVDMSKAFDNADIADAFTKAIEDNVDLIKSIPAEYFEDVRKIVRENWLAGNRWEDMVADIVKLGQSTDYRAKVIARDQTAKLNASFNQARQTGLGIKRYIWSGVGDKRERPSHLAMEGQVCEWNAPPLVDGERVHPGQAIMCRCSAVPVVDLALIESFDMTDPEAVAA